MRALLKKSAQCLLCAALVMALCPAMAFAQDSPTAQGVNPIMRLFKAPETISASGNSAGTGAIPEQTPVYSIYDANYDGLTAQESIPRSYGSVEKGRVTPVGNQGDLGICWAFSTIAAAESSILSEGLASSVDLSERHLAYFTYHRQTDPLGGTKGDSAKATYAGYSQAFAGASDLYLASGGNNEITLHALASWTGAADEGSASFSELLNRYESIDRTLPEEQRKAAVEKFLTDTALDSSLAYDDSYHLENGYMIAMEDRNDVKQTIMKYGAAATLINSNQSPQYFNSEHSAYYNYESQDTDHDIAVVGWDDDFSVNNFGLDDGWDGTAATSAPLISADESKDVTFDSHGIAWVRFEPATSGFYDVSCMASQGSPQSNITETVYRLDGQGGNPLWVNKAVNGMDSTCFLEKGTTYYVKLTREYGSATDCAMRVSPTPADASLPDSVTQIPNGQKVAMPAPDANGHRWLSFTPVESGSYTLGPDPWDESFEVTPYCVAIDDGLLQRTWVAAGNTISLKAGQTYYLRCDGGADTVTSLSVDLFKADGTVSADPRFPGFDCATTRPSSNGAWLCKNSWGTEFGEDGYFWISYEDACLNRPDSRVYVYDMAKADNYDNNYQYDGSPAPFYNTLPSGGSIANVFTAKANAQGGEELKAVSLAIYDVNVDYSIQIYVNPSDSDDPTSGSPVLAMPVQGRLTYGGFHTIELPTSVPLSQGTKYSVVATLSHADGSGINYAVDTSGGIGFASFTSECLEGQSFSLDPQAAAWHDLSQAVQGEGETSGRTARIKAFTDNTDRPQTLSIPISGADVQVTGANESQKPVVSVSYGGVTLSEGRHYSMASRYDSKSGLITIDVTGLDVYSGTKTVTYQSTPAEPVDPTPDDPKPDDPGTDPKPDDPGATDPEPVGTQAMYRLYNPNSGEHFYTASTVERDAVIAAGWNDEGIGWTAPTEGIQVYRLYNSFAGEHHYTSSEVERDALVAAGWTLEEGGWFSDPDESVPLYRAYNPNAFANNHHYTTDWGEFVTLLGLGWQDEGIGWHGVSAG